MPTEQIPDETLRHRWKALAICLVAAFMTLLDVSIVNVALPSIRSGLHASPDGLISGYAVSFSVLKGPSVRLESHWL